MSMPTPPVPLDDYEAISAAVMETERGRWFLDEFTRRNRAADTAAVLTALDDLERRMAASRRPRRDAEPSPNSDRLAGLLKRINDRSALLRNELTAAGSSKHVARALRQLGHLDRLLSLAILATGGEPPAPHALPFLPDDAESDEEIEIAEAADAEAIAQAMDPSSAAATDIPVAGAPAPAADNSEARTDVAAPSEEAAVAVEAEPVTTEPKRLQISPVAPRSTEILINGHAIEIFDDVEELESEDAVGSCRSATAKPEQPAEPVAEELPSSEPVIVELAERQGQNGAAEERSARPKMPSAWTPKLLDSLSDEEKAVLFA